MYNSGPRLKNGVDLQLQDAFYRENWLVASRLAEKRARTLNDQYYEIVKLVAESKIDDPSLKFAAVNALRKYVKEGTTIKDVDAVDLLDWATTDFTSHSEFADLIGVMRVRAAKAAPKDKIATTRCLESCLLHWDLVSAQQIAALIDRSFPQERSFMFWNIITTHMLAASPQSPPDKKKLFGMLAQKQIERAAQLTEGAERPDDIPHRGIKTEEEILLLYDVVETYGTAEDYAKLTTSPVFGPIPQLQKGRKELLLRVARRYRDKSNWQDLFDICKSALSQVDENDQSIMFAADWLVWKEFIGAAEKLADTDPEIQHTVQQLLLKVIKSTNILPAYKRNLQVARVAAAFAFDTSEDGDLASGKPSSQRLNELLNYLEVEGASPACFDDIKSWAEKLDADALDYLAVEHFESAAKQEKKDITTARKHLLSLKLQYLAAGKDKKRTAAVIGGTLELYKLVSAQANEPGFGETSAEVAILLAYCLLDVGDWDAGLPQTESAHKSLILAAAVLDHQLGITPEHSQVSLVLVQAHLLLGSVQEAYHVWEPLSVKRTILDSLGPVFYDRLSTVSPFILSTSERLGRELVYSIKDHFENSLKLRMPRRLIDAFESSSYGSVLLIPKYMDELRMGCARVMSLVEESRSARLLGSAADLAQDSRYLEVSDGVKLAEHVDYGSFPSWSRSSRPSIHSRLRLGPLLSSNRMHMSKLAEAFFETLNYKPPSLYKVASPIGENTFITESMARLSNSFAKFSPTEKEFTSAEVQHYELLSLLCSLVSLIADQSATISTVLPRFLDAVKAALDTQREFLDNHKENTTSNVVSKLSKFHEAALLRDSSVAVKAAAQWIVHFSEGSTGQSGLCKETVSQFKALINTADTVLRKGKTWTTQLKQDLASTDRLKSGIKKWLLEDEVAQQVKDLVEDISLDRLVKSWDKNVLGWQHVKWE